MPLGNSKCFERSIILKTYNIVLISKFQVSDLKKRQLCGKNNLLNVKEPSYYKSNAQICSCSNLNLCSLTFDLFSSSVHFL